MNGKKEDFLLYAVTDRSWLHGKTLYAQVEAALQGGVTALQLREKELDEEACLKEALQIQGLCRQYHVPFLLNDNVKLAKEIDADGVHVGQDDMAVEQAREILGPDKIIGVSAHNVREAVLAEQNGADYLGAGAVFATSSKADAGKLDHAVLREICHAVSIPVVAIGGVGRDNIQKLSGNGLSGVAVISAIFAQEDIAAAAANLRELSARMVAAGAGAGEHGSGHAPLGDGR